MHFLFVGHMAVSVNRLELLFNLKYDRAMLTPWSVRATARPGNYRLAVISRHAAIA